MNFLDSHNDDEHLINALRHSGPEGLSREAHDRILRGVLAAKNGVTEPLRERYTERRGFFLSFFHRPMIVAIILVIVLSAGTGTALAANNAKPGDTLFPVDQALEQVQLKLSLNQESRARVAAAIAEERQKEQEDLENEDGDDSRSAVAQEEVDKALERAATLVNEAKNRIDDSNTSAKAVNALRHVEDRLANIRERHKEKFREELQGLTEIEVKIRPSGATVKIEMNDEPLTFTVDSTNEAVIVAEIVKRTGVSEAAIRSILRIEREDDDSHDDDSTNTSNENTNTRNTNTRTNTNSSSNTNKNSNANSNGNSNGNSNTNSDDDNEDAWEIEVRVRDNGAEIKTKHGEDHQEWTLAATTQASILASITERTGLTSAAIIAVWSYEVDNE